MQTIFPPNFSSSFTAAAAVPPVASKSSMSRMLSPGSIASWWISTMFFPYSREYASWYVFQGSLPFFLTGVNPAPSASATGAPKINPRASMATTLSIFLSRAVSVSKSMERWSRAWSPSMGVMSLKTIPGSGKSWTSRMASINA